MFAQRWQISDGVWNSGQRRRSVWFSNIDCRRLAREFIRARLPGLVSRRRSLLIVAKPGLLRTSLVAVLNSAPEINVIAEADDLRLALSIIAQQRPDLMLVADDLNDQDWLALRQIKR